MLALDTLDPASLNVFAALLAAHVLSDFVFQTGWMVRYKRNFFVLLLHATIVFGFSTGALGGVWQVALIVAVAHFLIDAFKVWILPRNLRDSFSAFTADQLAHLATIIAAALWWPGAMAQGIWDPHTELLTPAALLFSGLVLTVIAGGYAVGNLTARFQAQLPQDGLSDAGRMIGQLERTLIFLLVMIGQPAGIGFLIAAKSILRFDTTAQQKAGEYVIIGTLASFTWALAMAYATVGLLSLAGW